jgi:catechol 2,3-dioxygenase-like lactoylglutathione lyase family enzyme/predicted enzyme related to lactoylglutathione lyase
MIIYGHHHLNVTSVEAHKKFWVHALGGTVTTVGETEAVMFPGVLVMFQQHRPAGGTKGTTVDHVGFQVRDIRQTIDRVKAAHFPMVTREEVKSVPPQSVSDDVAYIRNQDSSVAFTMGPDESKVEFVETQDATLPIALHHIHFLTQSADEMRDWYLRTLTASPAMRGNYKTAELPGVSLTFASSATPVVGTKGRTLDHIGFEVKGLEAFCKKLEAAGVEFDRSYASIPELGLSSAFVTDPWGTSVELTEGLTASGLTSTSSTRPFP